MSTHFISCSEIWGGVRGEDLEARTSGVDASLYSSSAEGSKGGDVYYISVCSSDLLTRVAIADVIGHGEAVSHISQWLYESLRDRMNSLEGNDVLADLNRCTSQRGYDAMTTAAVVSIHRTDSQLYFAYAGHHPMLAYQQRTKTWEPVVLGTNGKRANLLLGAFPEVSYDQELRAIARGDRLFLYTDGVLDAPDREGRSFGVERLLAVLEKAAGGPLHELKKAVGYALRKYTGGSLGHDDVTFIALEVR